MLVETVEKLDGPFPASFTYFILNCSLTENKMVNNIPDDWIQTRVLKYWKQPLCQLCCPNLNIVNQILSLHLHIEFPYHLNSGKFEMIVARFYRSFAVVQN